MAAPPADESAEDERGQQRRREEDKAGVHEAQLEGVHRLGGLDRRQGAAHYEVVHGVGGDQQVEADEDARPPLAAGGLPDSGQTPGAGHRERRVGRINDGA